jgi:polyamine oxidase
MAGLAAATTLHHNGHNNGHHNGHNVVVLEAEGHIGGRAHTDRTLGAPVHVGGTWMHGTVGHPVLNAELRSVASDFSQTPVFVANGPRFLAGDIHAALEPIEAALDERAKAAPEMSYTEAMTELAKFIDNAATELATSNSISRSHATQAIEAVIRGEYENLYSAPPNELSLQYRSEPYALPGDDCMIIDPLDSMLGPIGAKLDIRLNHQVQGITATDDGWAVRTTDGVTFVGDSIVVTVPIGTLQRNRITFDPPLPESFSAALHRLGPGAVAKAFFTFDSKFWTDQAWYVATEQPLIFDLWVDVSELTKTPTLCAFAAASVAADAEAMTEHELCREADRSLGLLDFEK